jgi:hypothetical protein
VGNIIVGDVRRSLVSINTSTIQCIATSPPYFGLRRYGDAGEEIGKERDLDAYVASLVDVMREGRRVLRDDGTAWINLGDSYAGSAGDNGPQRGAARRAKRDGPGGVERPAGGPWRIDGITNGNALLVPFRVAMALQQDGWILRAMLPWVKIASMPESVQSRPCIAHEYVLFLTKRASGYFYDADAVRVANAERTIRSFGECAPRTGTPNAKRWAAVPGEQRAERNAGTSTCGVNPAGRSFRSSDVWRSGAREAGAALLAAAEGEAVGMLTNDDAPAAFCVKIIRGIEADRAGHQRTGPGIGDAVRV